MAAFRPMGSAQGPLCPACGHPHLPFCVRHPSIPPTLPPSMPFQGHLPPRALVHSQLHPPLPPPHAAPFVPLAHHSSSYLGQPTLNRGNAQLKLEPQGPSSAKGLSSHHLQPSGRLVDGASLVNWGARPHGPPHAFHAQGPDSFHPSLPHSAMKESGAHSSQFPHSVSHSILPVITRTPASGWSQEDERDSDKVPAMPQWFIDQKRRSTIKGAAPNVRNVSGEFGRPEETFSVPPLKSEVPIQRIVNPARTERDRQIGFIDGDMQEKHRFENRFREGVQGTSADREVSQHALYHRADMGGHGDAQTLGVNGVAQMKAGFLTPLEFEGGRGTVGDRDRRTWGVAGSEVTNGPPGEPVSAFHPPGHTWVPSEPHQAPHQTPGRRDRSEDGRKSHMVDTATCREEQLLREHGLLAETAESLSNTRPRSFTDGPSEHQDGHGFPHGRPHFPAGVQVESGPTKPTTHGRTLGVDGVSPYTVRNDVRPGLGDKLHSGDKAKAFDRMHGAGERPLHGKVDSVCERSFSYGNQTSPNDEPGSSHQNGQKQHTPPQDELDELYYLKHFPQHDERQGRCVQSGNQGYHFSDRPSLQPSMSSVQAGMRDERRSLHDASAGSLCWPGDKRDAAAQNPGLLQLPDRGHHHLPPQVQCHGLGHFPQPPQLQHQEHTALQNVQTQHGQFQQSTQVQPRFLPPPQASIVRQSPLVSPVQFQQQSHPLQQSPAPPIHSQQPYQQAGGIQPNHNQTQAAAKQQVQSAYMQPQQHFNAPQQLQPQHPVIGHISTQRVLQNQSSAIQQVQQVSQSHAPRFYLNPQEMYQQYGNEAVQQQGNVADSGSEKPQVSTGTGRVSYHPPSESLVSPYLPPLPPPASAPPPPPPSPPHTPPPPHSPPAAPSAPPSPSKEQVGLNAAGFALAAPSDIAVEDRPLGYHYQHPKPGLHQPLQKAGTAVPGFQNLGTTYMQPPIYGQQYIVQQFPQKLSQAKEQPKVVDAVSLFRRPGRLARPERFVVILRGLPGSGKSYLARAIRDVELMNGGTSPRIHSMDDYFMTEVEKVEGEEGGLNSTSTMRGKKRVVKKVMEYCYEPEMEEVYRASMLKAFRKTLEEGMFSFVIAFWIRSVSAGGSLQGSRGLCCKECT